MRACPAPYAPEPSCWGERSRRPSIQRAVNHKVRGLSSLIRHREIGTRCSRGRPDMTPRKDEFRARLRARYAAADPEHRERRLARPRERRRHRYATDPVSGTGTKTLRQEDERVEPLSGLAAARPFPHPRRALLKSGAWVEDIFLRVYEGISEDRILANAAAVTFYTLLALFPGIAALVSIYGLFADLSSIAAQLDAVSGILTGGAVDVIRDQLKRAHLARGARHSAFKHSSMRSTLSIKRRRSAVLIRLNAISITFTTKALLSINFMENANYPWNPQFSRGEARSLLCYRSKRVDAWRSTKASAKDGTCCRGQRANPKLLNDLLEYQGIQ
jgi:hypothetical protein